MKLNSRFSRTFSLFCVFLLTLLKCQEIMFAHNLATYSQLRKEIKGFSFSFFSKGALYFVKISIFPLFQIRDLKMTWQLPGYYERCVSKAL